MKSLFYITLLFLSLSTMASPFDYEVRRELFPLAEPIYVCKTTDNHKTESWSLVIAHKNAVSGEIFILAELVKELKNISLLQDGNNFVIIGRGLPSDNYLKTHGSDSNKEFFKYPLSNSNSINLNFYLKEKEMLKDFSFDTSDVKYFKVSNKLIPILKGYPNRSWLNDEVMSKGETEFPKNEKVIKPVFPKELNDLILPHEDYEEVKISLIVERLNNIFKEKNIKYNVKLDFTGKEEPLITLEVNDITVGDLISYICQLSKMDCIIAGNTVYIKPNLDFPAPASP
jgi:hypothetical protein